MSSAQTCSECGVEYEGDPRSRYCSTLCKGRAKEARLKSRPESLAKRRASRRRAESARYERDRMKINARSRAYYRAHLEEQRAAARARYYANRELRLGQTRAWAAANRERHNANMRRGRIAYIARKMDAFRVPYSQGQLDARAAAWGNRCWMCGDGNWTAWDHVKPISKGGSDMLSNLRPACRSCNSSKSAKWYGTSRVNEFRGIV